MIVSLRNICYDRRILKVKDIPCKVISVGNFVVGGTGKTPVTIMTAKLLYEKGISVAVVSRGYCRAGKEPLIVSDGSGILVSAEEAGDEPHIIAAALDGVPVMVGSDRYDAARIAFDRFHPDVIVLDDAFQHRSLYRDVDIITVDTDDPMKSDYHIPRGLLRESPSSIKRAKAVVVTRYRDEHNRERIERMIRFYSRTVPIFWCRFKVKNIRLPRRPECIESHSLNGVRVGVISNVANPDSFYRMVEELGSTIVYRRSMPDHHRYTPAELGNIAHEALEAKAGVIIMTAKDERNLPEQYDMKHLKLLVLDIEAELVEGIEEFMKIVEVPKRKQA